MCIVCAIIIAYRYLMLPQYLGDEDMNVIVLCHIHSTSRQLKARRVLSLFKEPLRTRMVLLLYKVYSNSTLLVLNGISLNNDSALLALNRRSTSHQHKPLPSLSCKIFQTFYSKQGFKHKNRKGIFCILVFA